MFPRAARFDSERNNDVPGPNTYDPSTPESQYKRGAMFEKDARFRQQQRASISSSINGASPIASTSKVQMDTRLINLEKEKIKFEQRAIKAEEKVKELQSDINSWSREKKQMQIDHRLVTQKLEKIQSRSSGQIQNSLELQEIKQKLQASENSRLEDQNQLNQLINRFTRIEAEKLAAQEIADEMEKKCKANEDEAERYHQRIDALRSSFDQEKAIFKRKEEAMLQGIEEMNDRLRLAENEREAGRSRIAELEEENSRLRSQCDFNDDNSEEDTFMLERQRAALVSVSLRLASENSLLKHTCSQNAIETNYSAIRIRRLENSLIARNAEVAHLASTLASLKSEMSIHESRQMEDEMKQLHARMEASMFGSDAWDRIAIIEEHKEQQALLQELDRQDSHIANQQQLIHLEWRQNIIERLQRELEQSRSRNRELEDEAEENIGLGESLKTSHNNLIALEEAYESSLSEIQELRQNEDFLKMQIDQLNDEVHMISQRMQGVEGMDDRLYQATLRERGLLNDRQELLDDLARASNYEAAYYTIRAEAQKLLTRLTEYDLDANMFTNMNVALSSQKHSLQKIAYLDRIRTQLDETRVAYRLMEQERNKLHKQCRELLESMGSSNDQQRSTGKSPQSEQVSDVQDSCQPLDEREAAKRAWQARPKMRSARSSSKQSDSSSRGSQLRERPSRSRLNANQIKSDEIPPVPIHYRSLDDNQSDIGEGSSQLSTGTTLFEQQQSRASVELGEAPKRRYLRPQKSSGSLNDANRASPVASLPSIDALAWELDKENLLDKQHQYQNQQSKPPLPSLLLEGELTFQDLTGL